MQIQRIFLVIFFPISCLIYANSASSQIKEQSNHDINQSQEFLKEMLPIKQQKIVYNLSKFATQYKKTPNAIQKFLLRKKRKQFLNEQINDLFLTEWIGRIKELKTTENGKAFLEIELPVITPQTENKNSLIPEFKVTVETWKNSDNDLDYKTLILPDNPLYTWLSNFNEGDWIVFSGSGFRGEKDYLKGAEQSESKSMLTPKFILKFDFFDKIDLPNSDLNLTKDTSKVKNFSDNEDVIRSGNPKSSKTITIRYYKYYRLSNYDWNFKKYINRWNQLVRYHWNNHPPSDYLTGSIPEGGEIFVLGTVQKDGRVINYQVNSIGEVSKNMRKSALEAVRTVSLPPLPEDFPDDELKVEFRFEHSRMSHLIKKNLKQTKTVNQTKDNKTDDENKVFSKMEQKLIEKKLQAEARFSFNEELKQELSSHFKPLQRFDPNLEIQIELGIDRNGKVIEKKLTRPGKSVQFQLAVMNSLTKARFGSLPKSLLSQTPYRVRLKVIP